MSGVGYLTKANNTVADLWRGGLLQKATWVAVPFGLAQLLRLATSVVLSRLLAPEMLGIMVLINTLRTGTELLSDIGIGQSVVRSPNAHDPVFLDTAFTVQFARGLVLFAIGLLAAWPLSHFYGNPELAPIIILVSFGFLATGMGSVQIFVAEREMRVVMRSTLDLVINISACAISIALAAAWRNQWALVWSVVLSSCLATILTYVFTGMKRPHLRWRRDFIAEIVGFGKWIFLSTAIYFAAISTDKIYFSAVLSLAVVGIYGVARNFSDILGALAQRLGALLVFPKVVELRQRGAIASGFRHKRRLAMAAIAAAMAAALAGSDQVILWLYDARYHQAAFMLPLLLASVWFAVLAAFGEATLFGLDRPQASAVGNAVKFAVMIVGLPLLVPTYGILAGLLVLFVAEIGRWLALSIALQREHLASIGDDLGLTLLLVVTAFALKTATGAIGLTPTIAQWWALGASIHG